MRTKKEAQKASFSWLNCRDSKGGPECSALAQTPLKIQSNCLRNPPLSESAGMRTKKRGSKSLFFLVELPGLEPRTTEPKSAVLPLHHSSIRCSKATAKVAKKSEFAKTTPRNRDFASEIDLFSHCARLEILLLRTTPLCTTINIPLSFEIVCPQVRAHAFVFFKEKL